MDGWMDGWMDEAAQGSINDNQRQFIKGGKFMDQKW
jgi:hypothetical protein